MFSASPKKPGSQPPPLRPRTRDAGVVTTTTATTRHRVGPLPLLRERRQAPGGVRVLLTSCAARGAGGSGSGGGMLSWTAHLKGGGAPENIYHVAVAVGADVYSFGGFRNNAELATATQQNEVHVFNTVSLRWKQLSPGNQRPPEAPSIHEGYTAVHIGSAVYVWGGCSSVAGGEWRCYSALYAFDVDRHRWSRPAVSGSVPEARANHSACAVGNAMYVYGGTTRWNGQTNSMHALDTAMVWTTIGGRAPPGTPPPLPPPASSLHSSTAVGTTVFVFGGLGEHGERYGHVRAFDTERRRWLKATEPPTAARTSTRPEGRFGHSAFAHDGELYVFGGSDWERYFTDLWRFTPATSSWTKVRPKGGDCGPSPSPLGCWMCCCAVGGGEEDPHHQRLVVLFNKDHLYVLDLRPSLKTLCKVAVVRHGLERAGLPHNVRWEMAAMATQQRRAKKSGGKPSAVRGITGGNRRR